MALQIVSDLHTKINTAIGTTLADKAGDIINIISPVVMSAFMLYVLFVVMSYIKTGSDPTEMGFDFLQRFVSWSVVIGLSMNIGNFTSIVVPIVNGVPVELMNVFVPNGGDPYSALDTLVNTYLDTAIDGWNQASGIEATMLALIICAILLLAGGFLVIVGTAFLLLAEIYMTILLAIAPIFIALALFPQTRNYTSLWVAQVVNYGLLLVIISILIGLQISILQGVVVPATAGLNWSFVFPVFIISGVSVVMLLSAPAMAGALSGGMSISGFLSAKNAVSSFIPKGKDKKVGGGKGGDGDKGKGGGKVSGNSIKAEKAGK